MAKKQSKSKKRRIEVMVAEVEQIPNEMTKEQMNDALIVLQATVGWKIIAKNIKDNIAVLDQQILEKKTLDGEPLNDLECDRLRDKRGYLKEIGDTPQAILNRIKEDNSTTDDSDPFPRTAQELVDMRNKSA